MISCVKCLKMSDTEGRFMVKKLFGQRKKIAHIVKPIHYISRSESKKKKLLIYVNIGDVTNNIIHAGKYIFIHKKYKLHENMIFKK